MKMTLRNRKNLISTISVLLFLVVWEVLGRGVNPVFLSYPTLIAQAFYEIGIRSPDLLNALITSTLEFVVGFGIIVPAGVLLGLLMGNFRIFDYVLAPFISSIYATPRIVFIPLIVLWFGLEFKAKVIFIVLLAIFPVLINTHEGVKNTEASFIELARSFKASKWQIMTKITLPAALPYIIAGIKLSAGLAIIGVILSEMFTAMTGLGALLVAYANRFQTAKVFAVIVVIASLAVVINEIINVTERKLLHWKSSTTEF